MANFAGSTNTTQLNTEGRLIRDVAAEMAILNPNRDPFITLLTRVVNAEDGADNVKVEWFEDEHEAWWDTVPAGALVGDTTVNVADGTKFLPGYVIEVPKAVSSSAAPEKLLVTAVATNALTVTRGYAGTTAAAISAGAPVRVIASAYGEGVNRPSSVRTVPVSKYNNMQLFRSSFQMSRTAAQSQAYAAMNGTWEEIKRKKAEEHKRKMNAAFLFGKRNAVGDSIRTCDGLNAIISTNLYDAGGALSEDEFDEFCSIGMKYGNPDKKIMLASDLVMRGIAKWGKSKLILKTSETSYGLRVVRIITPRGEMPVFLDDCLDHPPGSTNGYGGTAFIVDVSNVQYRYLRGNANVGSSNTILSERGPNQAMDQGADDFVGEFKTEACPTFKQEKTHAKLFNVTSIA